jgi:putative tryptophan/tyrosine transport system substrate-binding protein
MRRRNFVKAVVGWAAVWPFAANAQRKQVRVGILATDSPTPAMLSAFREGLRELGYVEGQNLSIDVRLPRASSFEQSPEVVAELVRSGVDVLVAWATPSVVAARRATSTVPIIMVGVGDPVRLGLVASLARPGGNVTGTTSVSRDLGGKLVEILIEAIPAVWRVGVVRNPDNPGVGAIFRETQEAALAVGRKMLVVDARIADEFASAFARFGAEQVGAVVLLADPSLIENAEMIAELAQQARLPTVFQRRENVEAGGLLSYGPNLQDQFRKAASYAHRVFKGEKPADLPIERPTKFELVINLKTAKAIGLTIPPTLLARADDLIE